MWMSRPACWVVHKRAFVTLGHNSLPSACSGVGHKGIVQSEPVGGRAMPETYGYVRTSRPRVSELAGSDSETQRQQLLAAGVALSHIFQDVGVSGTSGTNSRRGWHSLHSRLAQADTLVVVSIDRIGRRWLDTMGNIHDLQRRGVRIPAWPITNSPGPSTWMPTPIRQSRSWVIHWPASPPGCPTKSWCPYAAVPRRVWRRRRPTERNWALPAGCPRSRRPRSSRWYPAESASGASPGPSAYRLRQSGAP